MRLGNRDTNKVVVSNHVSRFRIPTTQLARLARAMLARLGYRNTFLSLVFVSDRTSKRLNQRYLNHSWATDVLAFPFSDFLRAKKAVGTRLFLGEVIISPQRAKVHSRRFHTTFREELVRYICHAILHLKGYSGHSLRARNAMRRAEDQLLKPIAFKIKGGI